MRRGMTIVEALIAAAVASTALAVVAGVLVVALRGSARGIARAELQQSAATASRWLLEDLQASAPGAISLPGTGPGPAVACIHRLAGVSPDGTQIWEEQLVCYVWSAPAETLTRKTWPPAPPALGLVPGSASPLLLTPPQAQAVAVQRNGRERVLAHRLKLFRLTGDGAGVTLPLHLKLEFAASVAGREEPEKVDYECSINLWNRVL